MEWIAAAIVFCFLMWKWPRNTIIGLLSCAAIAAIVLGGIFAKSKYDEMKREDEIQLRERNRIALERIIKEKEQTIQDTLQFGMMVNNKNNSDSYKCKHGYFFRDKAHGIFTITNNTDIDILGFTITIEVRLKNHSTIIATSKVFHDIIINKHSESIEFCLGFLEDTGLEERVPKNQRQHDYMIQAGGNPLSVDDLDFQWTITDFKHN